MVVKLIAMVVTVMLIVLAMMADNGCGDVQIAPCARVMVLLGWGWWRAMSGCCKGTSVMAWWE